MNHIYRTLWSVATQSWQAVPENARTGGKKSTSNATGVVASVALSWVLTSGAHAQSPPAINQLPTNGVVARGTATINQTATAQAAAMTVNQSSQRAVINWNSFNLGQSASVNFVQPNAQAVTLNRVNDSNPSQIFGRITANGQVFLSNANGVYFSPTSSVDVGAFTATTHSISDDNFMSGNYVFERNGSTGKITNEGNINAALGGYVALLAPEVQNAGVVVAKAGTVALAAGELITLNIDNNGSLAGITTTPSAIASLIENKLAVQAPDGQIILSAVGLSKLQTGVIKNSGSLDANSISHKGGKIYLEGDDITLTSTSKIEAKGATGGGTVLVGGDWQGSGDLRQATKVTMEAGATIDASATDNGYGGKVVLWSDVKNADSVTRVSGSIKAEAGPNGGDGGQVETSSHLLKIGGIQVSTKAPQGSAGKWLLDPYNVTISTAATATDALSNNVYTASANSSVVNAADLQTALANGNVEVTTAGTGAQQGNITVASDITWSNASTLTLTSAGYLYGTSGKTITIGTNGTLVLNPGFSNSFASNIAGDGRLSKTGAGTTSLTGTNTYTGTTTVTGAGWLAIGGGTATGSLGSGNVIVNSGTYIAFGRTDTNTYSNNISGAGGIYALYGGTTTLTGVLSYTGSTGIDGSTLIIGNGGTGGTGIGAVGISNNGKLKINLSNDFTVSGGITGTGSIEQAGTGATTLTGSNTYTGTTTISAGTLQIGAGLAAGTLGTGDVLNNGSLKFNRDGSLTVNNNISGSGSLEQAGTSFGPITLGGSNSYTGLTTVTSGTLVITTASALGTTAGATTVASGAILDLQGVTVGNEAITLNGGTLKTSSGISSLSGAVTLSANSSISVTGALTLSGSISGNYGLTKSATGQLTLTGQNSYGTTTISAGTLQIGSGGTTGTLGSGAVTDSGTLIFNRSDAITISNAIGGGGSVTQAGTGTTTLAGSNSYTGATTVSSGTLAVTNASALGTAAGATTVASGATLDLQGVAVGAEAITLQGGTLTTSTGTSSLSGAVTLSANSTVNVVGTQLTLSGVVSGAALTKAGAGTLILSGANSYTGTTTISEGSLQIGAGGTTGTLGSGAVTDNGALIFNRSDALTVSNAISGSGSLTQAGTGTTTLTGTNSYGATTISAGALQIGIGSTTGTLGTGPVTDYATLFINRSAAYSLSGIGVDSSGITGTGNIKIQSASGALTIDRNISLTGASSRIDLLAHTLAGGYAPDGTDLTFGIGTTISTSPTGTIVIYSGTANTAALISSMSGATGSTKYKTYNTTANGLSGAVTGTINFYYRQPESLTATGLAITATKVYDKTTSVTGATFTQTGGSISGAIDGDSYTASMSAGTFSNSGNVGATLSGVTASATSANSGWSLAGFTFNCTCTYSGTITPKALTVTGTTVISKTYDATNSASFSPLTSAALVGVLSGDAANLTLSQAGTYTQTGIGSAIPMTMHDSLSGSAASNYSLTQPSGVVGAITPKAVTVSGLLVPASRVYDGTFAAAVSGTPSLLTSETAGAGSSTDGKIYTGDSVTFSGTATGTYNSKDVATANTVTFSGLTSSNPNYTLTLGTQAATITPKALTVSGLTAASSRVYDGTVAATVSGTPSLLASETAGSGTSTDGKIYTTDSVTLNGTASGAYNTKDVATANLVTFSGLTSSNGNYTLSLGTQAATITPKALTVGGLSVASSRVYDGTLIATVSGAPSLLASEAAGSGTSTDGKIYTTDSVTFNGTASGVYNTKDVATANLVTFSGLTSSNSNYTLLLGTQAATITPKALTVGGLSVASSRVYDGTVAATVSGTPSLLASETAGSGTSTDGKIYTTDSVTLTGTVSGAYNTKDVATANLVTFSGLTSSNGNYTLSLGTQAATITPAPLTVTADNASRNFGASNPAFSVTVSGYVTGETAATSGVTGTGSATSATTAVTDAGTSPIMAGIGTLAATNYAFTRFVDGTLTIRPISALSNTDVATLIGAQLANLSGSQVGSFSTTQLQVFSPKQLGALSPSQVAGLTITQLLSLTPDQLAAISPAKIASMAPDQLAGLSVSQFAGLTTSQLQALSAAQIAAISTAQLGQLSSAQITALTSNAAASLSFQQIAALTPRQIVGVNPVEVASFTATQIGALSIPQLQALSLLQVAAISPTSLSSLTPQQIAGLTSNAAASLSFQQIATLAPTQIVGVDAARVASLTAAEIGSLSDAQLQALSLLQIAAIAPDHFSALSPAQIMALSITQVINLTPDQLRGFSPAQVASLSAAELAYFDARQLAAIGIVPKTEAPVAQAPVPTPVAAPSVEAPVPPAIATSNQLPLNFEAPNAPVEQVAASATSTANTAGTASTASEADANDARNKFQAAIPVMTAVAGANAPAAVPAAAPTPITAAPVTTTVSTAVTATTTATPTAPAAGVAQSSPSVTLTTAAAQTGVLAITILSNAEPKPTTAGVAFEQDGNSVTLRTASAPPTPPASDKLTFNDNLTTFMVSSASGGLIEFKASLVNRRLVILAQSSAAKQIARTEMNVVLAAAITSLGAENRVMLANLDGVVLDLR